MEFKQFLAIYLVIVITGSALITVIAPRPEDSNNVVPSGHFSVRWMGFSPTDYNNSYPEYTICINNLRDDPLRMQIAFQIKNQEAQGYYVLIDGYSAPAGWSFDPYQIGYVSVDETKPFVYENVTRIVPSTILQGRLTETITLVVKAYHNDTYTNLYSEDYVDVTFNLIDRTSESWTILYHDDFDDNTTQGWQSVGDGGQENSYCGHGISLTASPDYYRSFQYSLKLSIWASGTQVWNPIGRYYDYYAGWQSGGVEKTFTIGNEGEAYLLFSLKSSQFDLFNSNGIKINGTTYFMPDVVPSSNIWYQFAVPLQKDSANIVDIWLASLYVRGGSGAGAASYLDDIFVIAK